MRTRRGARLAALAALWLFAAGSAGAAGGHHGVDDANILPAGECEQETWFTRAQGGGRLLHAGLSCRVGPVELGVAGEHARDAGSSQTAWNLEAKWAREVAAGFSLGAVVQPVWIAHQRPRLAGTMAAALATWNLSESLALHANFGRDFVRGSEDLPRGGVAAEWTPAEGWSLVAERYLEQRTHFARAGVRWAAGRTWSLDLTRAQRLSGPTPSNWTLGLTLGFGRD
jgi:hypothetical protein